MFACRPLGIAIDSQNRRSVLGFRARPRWINVPESCHVIRIAAKEAASVSVTRHCEHGRPLRHARSRTSTCYRMAVRIGRRGSAWPYQRVERIGCLAARPRSTGFLLCRACGDRLGSPSLPSIHPTSCACVTACPPLAHDGNMLKGGVPGRAQLRDPTRLAPVVACRPSPEGSRVPNPTLGINLPYPKTSWPRRRPRSTSFNRRGGRRSEMTEQVVEVRAPSQHLLFGC
jgi:hypothetical protein